MSRYLVVANSAAGSHEQEAITAATAVLDADGGATVTSTSEASELEEVIGDLGDRVLVVAGGDGSLHAVVNALLRLDRLGDVVIGLVPLGTGNDFARGTGIPLDPAEAAAAIRDHDEQPTDLIVDCFGTIVVNGVHLGVGADASRASEVWKPRLGRLGYVAGAVIAGLRPQFVRVRVCVDEREVYAGHVVQVAIGNSSHVGGGTELIPGADPDSGTLTVIVSRELTRLGRLAYMAHLRRGEHHRMREVTRLRGHSVSVEGEPFLLSTDGELSGPLEHCSWEVLPGALRMRRP